MHKDIKKIVKALKAQGWRIEQGSKHLIAYPPDKTKRPITIPGSPGDVRSQRNLVAQLRRAGADL